MSQFQRSTLYIMKILSTKSLKHDKKQLLILKKKKISSRKAHPNKAFHYNLRSQFLLKLNNFYFNKNAFN